MKIGTDKAKVSLNFKEKWIIFGIMAVITALLCGHLAAVIERGAGLDNWSAMLLEHIQTEPLDIFHVNYYVLYFVVCIYTLVFFIVLSKRELPKAEMKGIEHGSNDFQTDAERNEFLTHNTTPVYSLDLQEFKGRKLEPDESEKEKKREVIFRWRKEKSEDEEREKINEVNEKEENDRSGKGAGKNWKRE